MAALEANFKISAIEEQNSGGVSLITVKDAVPGIPLEEVLDPVSDGFSQLKENVCVDADARPKVSSAFAPFTLTSAKIFNFFDSAYSLRYLYPCI